MGSIPKNVIATGASSGLGFEAMRQLLCQSQPHKIIIGARNVHVVQAAYKMLEYDRKVHSICILPMDLADLNTVKSFAQRALQEIHDDRLDVLLLNAGMNKAAKGPGLHGSQWCEAYVVNHLSQHYLTRLLCEKLSTSHARIVVVSSGLIRGAGEHDIDIASFKVNLKANSGADGFTVYRASKFIQFLGAHWWRRRLRDSATVLAVSPGLVVGTGLGRHLDFKPDLANIPDKLTVEEGAKNILRAMNQFDFPQDEERLFFTSEGKWWDKHMYSLSLDQTLQDEWCPSLETMQEEINCIR